MMASEMPRKAVAPVLRLTRVITVMVNLVIWSPQMTPFRPGSDRSVTQFLYFTALLR